MKCMYCGTENSPQNVYCRRCGKYIYAGNQSTGKGGYSSQQNNNSSSKIILAGVLSFFAVLLVVGGIGAIVLFGGSSKDQTIEDFRKKVNAFEELVDAKDFGVNEEKYETIITDSREIIRKKEKASIEEQETKIDDAEKEMAEMDNILAGMRSMKDTYTAKYTKYEMKERFEKSASKIHQKMDTAIENKDTAKKAELEKKYAELEEKLLANNQDTVDKLRGDISRMDTSCATSVEQAQLTTYNDNVSAYLQDGDYLHAIQELRNYKTYASSIQADAPNRRRQTTVQSQPSMPTVNTGSSEYILPDSSSRYLTDADVYFLSKHDANLAKNEIFARHGRTFRDPSIQNYFNSKSWYVGIYAPDDVDFNDLSKIEQANVNLLKKYE